MVVPDTTAIIFWLKNRQPGNWRDKQVTETTVNLADEMASLMKEISDEAN